MNVRAAFLIAGAYVLGVTSSASAIPIVTNSLTTFSPISPPFTVIDMQVPLGASPLSGAGYLITFSGVPNNQGIVEGGSLLHAIPVAGVLSGSPAYLPGNFQSGPLTTFSASSGNYLSTDFGTITITFTTPQTGLTLLWGSIDTGNDIAFGGGTGGYTGYSLDGTAVNSIQLGGNGFQGVGGSEYVAINAGLPGDTFTSVAFTSNNISFEFAGVAGCSGSTGCFATSAVPEPGTLGIFGAVLIGLGLIRMTTLADKKLPREAIKTA
jgi:hypothetical protein